MKKTIVTALLLIFLFSRTVVASGWETAGKILAGVIIGHVITEVAGTPCRERRIEIRPVYREYQVWVPGRYEETYAYEIIPGGYEKRLVEREDGTFYEIEVRVPPSTRPVIIREWIPGRWETRYERMR